MKEKRRAEIYAINSVMKRAFEEKFRGFAASKMCDGGTHGVPDKDVLAAAREGSAGINFEGVGAV